MPAKLVTIGDSLTQGFQSGAITRTEWSWPAMVARCIGAAPFKTPDFHGAGGLPLNLEEGLRRIQRMCGDRIHPVEVPLALSSLLSYMDTVEDFWERGPGAGPSGKARLHHNLAVWGFELEDADSVTEASCRRAMPTPKSNWYFQNQIPEMPMYRTARRTLNPLFDRALEDLSQLDAAAAIASAEGGVENLVVCLGANNALATTTSLKIQWSQSADLHKLPHARESNLWAPEHFQKALDRVVPKVQAVKAGRVFIGNVPHVTIAPVARGVSVDTGVNGGRDEEGYFEFYTHFWIWDEDFRKDPDDYPKLTREEARTIDRVIDEYNAMIETAATRNGWFLVDLCGLLDELAYRRQGGRTRYVFPPALVQALRDNPATSHRVTGSGQVLLDTRFLGIFPEHNDPLRRYRGGLFSLDGIHPTTIGYGIVAQKILDAMGEAMNRTLPPVPWPEVVAADTLVGDLPPVLEDLKEILAFLSRKGPLQQLTKTLGDGFLS